VTTQNYHFSGEAIFLFEYSKLKNKKPQILTWAKRAYCTLNLPVVSLYVGPIVTHKN
jgi:hypothetical protein